ncbi:hypothetical protein TWF281_002372 [Arthrobotrys megalospora]
MLLQLPNELIGTILTHLPRRDLFNVATCSQLLHSLAIPILYSSVQLLVSNKLNEELQKWELSVDEDLVRLLVSDERRYGKYIRQIRVVQGEKGVESPSEDTETESIPEEYSHSKVEGEGNRPQDGEEEEQEREEEREGNDEEQDEDDESEDESEDDIPRILEPSDGVEFAITGQISSLLEMDEIRLTSFKWRLFTDIPPRLFRKLAEMPGNSLSTIEISSHGHGRMPCTLPKDSLPCLRKFVVRDIYSPRRVVELHYILRASPGLQSFGFYLGEEASPEARDYYFQFSDSEIAGVDVDLDGLFWEKKPTHWTDFIENCIFRNLQEVPLKELRVGGIRLTSKMAQCLPLETLHHLHLQDPGTSFDFIEALDMARLKLETFNIVYERIGENCVYRKFVGDLPPGLRHLGFLCTTWDIDPDNVDHGLEGEYPGIFSLPEEFTERQKGTLETMTFSVLIHDWQTYQVNANHGYNFKVSPQLSKLTEISVPLLLTKIKSKKKLPNGPIPGIEKHFWEPMTIAVESLSMLPNLRILTLNPISTEYRTDFIENIFEPDVRFRQWVDMYQERLVGYIDDLVSTYTAEYSRNSQSDQGPPPLKWIFVVGGEECGLEVGFRVEWNYGDRDGKYGPSTTMLPGPEARRLVKTEDMRFRKYCW